MIYLSQFLFMLQPCIYHTIFRKIKCRKAFHKNAQRVQKTPKIFSVTSHDTPHFSWYPPADFRDNPFPVSIYPKVIKKEHAQIVCDIPLYIHAFLEKCKCRKRDTRPCFLYRTLKKLKLNKPGMDFLIKLIYCLKNFLIFALGQWHSLILYR